MCLIAEANNAGGRMSAMHESGVRLSEIPLLRFRDQKVAEDLYARDRFEFFRIDKERIEREIVDVAEKLHQPAVFFDEVVRQHRDAEPALTRTQQTENIVDGEPRLARALTVASRIDQPSGAAQIGRHRAAQHQQAMIVEFLVTPRRTEALQVFGGRAGVEVHREELTLDQVRLRWQPQPDRNVSLAHREIELLLGGHQRDADIWIELEEVAEPRGEPMHAQPDRRLHLQFAMRLLAAIRELGARRLELHEHFVRGAVQQLALLGEDQPARVAMKQWRRELLLQRAHLT